MEFTYQSNFKFLFQNFKMDFDIFNLTTTAASAMLEAGEAAAILASPTPPHGVHHKLLAENFTKRELMEQGVQTLLNDWRYQVRLAVIARLETRLRHDS